MVTKTEGKENVIASLDDDGVKVSEGIHKGIFCPWAITAQHPIGIQFQIPWDDETIFRPFMIDIFMTERLKLPENGSELELKAEAATREHILKWCGEVNDKELYGENGWITFGLIEDFAIPYYEGYLAALTAVMKS